jgi:hypothetical protein
VTRLKLYEEVLLVLDNGVVQVRRTSSHVLELMRFTRPE